MLQSGGTVNTERAAIAVLDEFRSGKIGKITLETPQNRRKRTIATVLSGGMLMAPRKIPPDLYEFERIAYAINDFTWVCGVDEAGRGPLAGIQYLPLR